MYRNDRARGREGGTGPEPNLAIYKLYASETNTPDIEGRAGVCAAEYQVRERLKLRRKQIYLNFKSDRLIK